METASFCVSTFSAPDFDAEEIRATVASAFKENRTAVPPQYDLSKNEKGAFGAQVHLMPATGGCEGPLDIGNYTDGENLISKDPVLSMFVFENLPQRLKRVIQHCKDRHQSMVMGLSAMVALSAEPKEPKQVELKIPANISKSMVLHHLDQNGEVGCAMFDAEANSLTNANKQECGNFMSDLKRHGLITLRLAMILAALRKAETKSEESLIYCSDIDFPIAMEITSCCIEHSFILSTTLPDEQTGMLKARNPKPMMELFNNLPNPFTLKEALEVAETLHIKKRTLYVYLKKAERKMIEKIAPGYYKKL